MVSPLPTFDPSPRVVARVAGRLSATSSQMAGARTVFAFHAPKFAFARLTQRLRSRGVPPLTTTRQVDAVLGLDNGGNLGHRLTCSGRRVGGVGEDAAVQTRPHQMAGAAELQACPDAAVGDRWLVLLRQVPTARGRV